MAAATLSDAPAVAYPAWHHFTIVVSGFLVLVGLELRSALWVSVAAALVGYAGAAACKRFPGDINPGVIYGIAAGTTFGTANAAFCLALGSGYRDIFVKYGDTRFLFPAACVGLIGTAAPLFAYYWTSRLLWSRKAQVGASMTRSGTRRFAYALLVASVIARVVPTVAGALGSLSAVLDLGPSVAIFILRLDSLSEKRKRAVLALLPVVLLVAEVAYAFAFEFLRTAMIWPLLAYLLPLFMAAGTRRLSRASRIALVSATIAGFVLIFSQFGEARQQYTGGERLNAVLLGSGEAQAEDQAVSELDSVVAVVARLSTLNQLSALENIVAKEGTFGGETLKPLLFAPIPRLLWPGKPQIVPGQEYARRLGRGSELGNGRFSNAINTTLPGDFRLNFGWLAAIGASLFFGSLLAWAWSLCRHFAIQRNAPAAAGAFLLFTQSAFVGSNAAAFLDVFSTVAAAWLLGLAVRYIGRRGAGPPRPPVRPLASDSGQARARRYSGQTPLQEEEALLDAVRQR